MGTALNLAWKWCKHAHQVPLMPPGIAPNWFSLGKVLDRGIGLGTRQFRNHEPGFSVYIPIRPYDLIAIFKHTEGETR